MFGIRKKTQAQEHANDIAALNASNREREALRLMLERKTKQLLSRVDKITRAVEDGVAGMADGIGGQR